MQIDALINDLLATGTMTEETTADLNRMLDEHRAGTLDPDDADYIRALHARITDTPITDTPVTDTPAAADEPAVTEPERLDGHSITEWRDRALRAEAELAALKDEMTTT